MWTRHFSINAQVVHSSKGFYVKVSKLNYVYQKYLWLQHKYYFTVVTG